MKVLITGAKGQLGHALQETLESKGIYKLILLGRDELDITKPAQVSDAMGAAQPEVVLHAAANTNVDGCELAPDQAYLVNALGTRNIAAASAAVGAKLVYFSTDYVFDGSSSKYNEFDTPNPISIYGKSKLAGERFVSSLSNKFFIVRTAWLYGPHGKNFVKTMLKLAEEKSELNVVNDQVGSPTYTKDLASFIDELIRTDLYGTYHATNTGCCSWNQFARTIFKISGMEHIEVKPITTAQLNRPAPRPAFSVLDHYCIRRNGLTELRSWEEALAEFMEILDKEGWPL